MGTAMLIDNKKVGSKDKEAIIKSENEGQEDSWCPLFSEGLPSDFATNSKLAALASLLNDDSSDDNSNGYQHSCKNENQKDIPDPTYGILQAHKIPSSRIYNNRSTTELTAAGGGKVKRNKRRQRRSGIPYDKASHMKSSSAKTASVGEAQLFLNLWKI